jgi:hypothetical protein
MKDPIQKRIDARIKIKDAREDSKQRSITVAWSINAAINSINSGGQIEQKEFEKMARYFLSLFDKLFEERSQEQARKYEEADNAMDAAEHDAGNE